MSDPESHATILLIAAPKQRPMSSLQLDNFTDCDMSDIIIPLISYCRAGGTVDKTDCIGCMHFRSAIDACLLHRQQNKPRPISSIPSCYDFEPPVNLAPLVDDYLSALPTNLIEDLELDIGILSLFVHLVFCQNNGSSPPFWFFSDPYYSDGNDQGHLELCDYRSYDEVEKILKAFGYNFCRPAGMVRQVHISNAERKEFFELYGKYYTVAASAVHKLNWKIKRENGYF